MLNKVLFVAKFPVVNMHGRTPSRFTPISPGFGQKNSVGTRRVPFDWISSRFWEICPISSSLDIKLIRLDPIETRIMNDLSVQKSLLEEA